MPHPKHAAHAFDQSRQQRKEIVLGITDQPKLVAVGLAGFELESLERHAITEQTHAKMEFMPFTARIVHLDQEQLCWGQLDADATSADLANVIPPPQSGWASPARVCAWFPPGAPT